MAAEDGETADAADGISTDVDGKLTDPTTTADRKLIDDAMVDA